MVNVCLQAVSMAAELCLEYSIYEVQLWNIILKQLAAFHMVGAMIVVYYRINGVPNRNKGKY